MNGLWHRLRQLGLALFLALLLLLLWAKPVLASVYTYHEQPGQTTYRSRQSLRDQTDLAWQATVFKRYLDGNLQGVYLRLVGFPGQRVVNATGPLAIQTGTSAQWQVPYSLDPQLQALPENVAQYDIAALLSQLQGAIPLTLVVPLVAAAPARLVVAPYVVAEWLEIQSMTDAAQPSRPSIRPDSPYGRCSALWAEAPRVGHLAIAPYWARICPSRPLLRSQ